ncbi:hypothetical protein BC833DRAFT_608319, partial [Globomyces pollinis-pini]
MNRSFGELAKLLRKSVDIKQSAGIDSELLTISHVHGKDYKAISQTHYLPGQYIQDINAEAKRSDKIILTPKPDNPFSVKRLKSKKPRYLNDMDVEITPGIVKSQGKKLSSVENHLRDILQMTEFERKLKTEYWDITRLSLSVNEENCIVYWKLNESRADKTITTASISNLLIEFEPAIQKLLLGRFSNFRTVTPKKFCPRITFKRDIAYEKKLALDSIFKQIEEELNN